MSTNKEIGGMYKFLIPIFAHRLSIIPDFGYQNTFLSISGRAAYSALYYKGPMRICVPPLTATT